MSAAIQPAVYCRRCGLQFFKKKKHALSLGGPRGFVSKPLELKFPPRLVVRSADPKTKSPLPDISRNPKEWTREGLHPYKVIQNYRKSTEIVSCLDPNEYKDTTVIEAAPGPGVFSRALYNHIAPKKHILLDHMCRHYPGLDPMVNAAPSGVVKYLDRNPWLFKSYSDFLEEGIAEFIHKQPNEENPSLLFVANLVDDRSWKTESVTAHLLQFMHKHCFVYSFGRIRTWLWIQAPHWYPLLAPVGHKNRKKITIMRELCCDARVLAFSGKSTRKKDIEEVPEFDKSGAVPIVGDMFYPNAQTALIELIPYEKPLTDVPTEEIEYLILKMMMLKHRSLVEAMKLAAPGGDVVLESLDFAKELTPDTLTVEQWVRLFEAFHKWPFKPDVFDDESRYMASGSRLSVDEVRGGDATGSTGEEILEDLEEDDVEDEEDEEFERVIGVAK